MSYSNYFNSSPGYANYTNIATSYANNTAAPPYGSTCAMTYTNYANASHAAPVAFDIGVDQARFNVGSKINRAAVQEISDLRAALVRLSTEKVQSTGYAAVYNPDITLANFTQASNTELAVGKKIRAAQINELNTATQALWAKIDGSATTWPTVKTAGASKIYGSDLKTLADRAQTMANCTQTGYKNTKTEHDGYSFPAGTNGSACFNSTTWNGYYSTYQNAAQGTAGYNGTCAHGW